MRLINKGLVARVFVILGMTGAGIYYSHTKPQNFKVESTASLNTETNSPAFLQAEVARICTKNMRASFAPGFFVGRDPAMIEAVRAGLEACKVARSKATLRVIDHRTDDPATSAGVMVMIDLARTTGMILVSGNDLPINQHGVSIAAACIPIRRADNQHGNPPGTQMKLIVPVGRGHTHLYCRLPSQDELVTLATIGSA